MPLKDNSPHLWIIEVLGNDLEAPNSVSISRNPKILFVMQVLPQHEGFQKDKRYTFPNGGEGFSQLWMRNFLEGEGEVWKMKLLWAPLRSTVHFLSHLHSLSSLFTLLNLSLLSLVVVVMVGVMREARALFPRLGPSGLKFQQLPTMALCGPF